MTTKNAHYFKNVDHLKTIDVYRTLELFGVTDPCIAHAVKKLLVAGNRGGGKSMNRDIDEAIQSLERWQQMRKEDGDLLKVTTHEDLTDRKIFSGDQSRLT